MTIAAFVSDLLEGGIVRVSLEQADSQHDLTDALDLLRNFERDYRLELPGTPPPLFLPAVRWSVRMFFLASRFTVYRDLGVDAIVRDLAEPCPEPASAASHYSVDLMFRFLPDLHRLARGVSQDDPLVARLKEWAIAWPLSSVGMKEIVPPRLEPVLNHPCLLQMYVDRILATEDAARLEPPAIRAAAVAAWGAFPELGGKLAKTTPGV